MRRSVLNRVATFPENMRRITIAPQHIPLWLPLKKAICFARTSLISPSPAVAKSVSGGLLAEMLCYSTSWRRHSCPLPASIRDCPLASNSKTPQHKVLLTHYQTLVEYLLEQQIGIEKYFSYIVLKSSIARTEMPLEPFVPVDR
jgi:hypothetical protein